MAKKPFPPIGDGDGDDYDGICYDDDVRSYDHVHSDNDDHRGDVRSQCDDDTDVWILSTDFSLIWHDFWTTFFSLFLQLYEEDPLVLALMLALAI